MIDYTKKVRGITTEENKIQILRLFPAQQSFPRNIHQMKRNVSTFRQFDRKRERESEIRNTMSMEYQMDIGTLLLQQHTEAVIDIRPPSS